MLDDKNHPMTYFCHSCENCDSFIANCKEETSVVVNGQGIFVEEVRNSLHDCNVSAPIECGKCGSTEIETRELCTSCHCILDEHDPAGKQLCRNCFPLLSDKGGCSCLATEDNALSNKLIPTQFTVMDAVDHFSFCDPDDRNPRNNLARFTFFVEFSEHVSQQRKKIITEMIKISPVLLDFCQYVSQNAKALPESRRSTIDLCSDKLKQLIEILDAFNNSQTEEE